MKNQLGMLTVNHMVLVLTHPFRVVGTALREWMPESHTPAQGQSLVQRLEQRAALGEGAIRPTDAITEKTTLQAHRTEPELTMQDVAMDHLFWLNTKIGR